LPWTVTVSVTRINAAAGGKAMRTTERRRERRQITYLGGEVTYNQQRSGMNCLVRNIAPSGALVTFADRTPFPEELELHVPQRGRSFYGTVVWRRLNRAGLALQPLKADDSEASPDIARRQRALKKENRALRRRFDSPI
jgi:hypothetical protein